MAPRNIAVRLAICGLLACAAAPSPAAAQQADVQVDGLVLSHQKYSFTMRGLDRDYHVAVPNGTPLLMKLTTPELDFSRRQLSVEILLSAPDGDRRNNIRVARPIPDPLFLSADFDDEASRALVLGQGVHELPSFVLSPRPAESTNLSLEGRLLPGSTAGQYELQIAERVIQVQLGPRRGQFANASVMDLRPHETEVFVDGRMEGETIIASRIRFQPVGDPFARFDPALPNVLVIGDQTSLSYDRALRELLTGQANVHHPPCNCGGSENWNSLHRWLANPDGATRRWDVIVFNFGLHDQQTTQAAYTENIRRAIEILKATGADLIWTTTIPQPNGRTTSAAHGSAESAQAGRTTPQNEWAATVLDEHPDALVCDLWQVVSANADGAFDEWWSGSNLSFNYPASVPLAQAIADTIQRAAAVAPTAGK